VMEQTRIYPLGRRESARPMAFPDASAVASDMLHPCDSGAFDLLARFMEHEYLDSADRELYRMAAAIGIVKGRHFSPDARARELLDAAACTAARMGHVMAISSGDPGSYLDARAGFATHAAYTDADGNFLLGDASYRLHLPPGVPEARFWSVSVHDPVTGCGLDNGQPFPSISTMDRPVQNADGSTDICFAPWSPGPNANWLRTNPGQGWFVITRLCTQQQASVAQTWKPDHIVKLQ
jgi:hypothetical protein